MRNIYYKLLHSGNVRKKLENQLDDILIKQLKFKIWIPGDIQFWPIEIAIRNNLMNGIKKYE